MKKDTSLYATIGHKIIHSEGHGEEERRTVSHTRTRAHGLAMGDGNYWVSRQPLEDK